MNKSNSIETIDRTNLTDQTKFRLNEIIKFENYFNQEIKERKLDSKKISKNVAPFGYVGKILIAKNLVDWWRIYYFFFNCYWSSCRNSKWKFYFIFFFNYRNN